MISPVREHGQSDFHSETTNYWPPLMYTPMQEQLTGGFMNVHSYPGNLQWMTNGSMDKSEANIDGGL